jgi:hypothetical protein
MSGTNGPRMLVRKEMTKKIRKTRRTMPMLRFIFLPLFWRPW